MGRRKQNIIKLTEEQQKLVTDNINLAYSRAYKYSNKYEEYDLGYDQDDFVSFAQIGLCYAARAFKLEKGLQFSTYAVNCIDQKIKEYVLEGSIFKVPRLDNIKEDEDKEKVLNVIFNSNVEYFDKYIDEDDESNNDLYSLVGREDQNLDDVEIINDLKAILNEKEYNIVIDKIIYKLSLSEIVEKYGFTSKQSVVNMYSKYLKKIRDNIKYVA
jgi:RNA polymerase sigma factor (sigma-70 family)